MQGKALPPQTPITIRTLGDFLAHPGHTLTAHCPKCQHSELLKLVERYGGDIEPREIAPLLRCRQCDHKGGEIRVGARSSRRSGAGAELTPRSLSAELP